jgi:hypothetical protein
LPGQRLAPRCRQRSPASLPDNHMTADAADVMTGSIRLGGDLTEAWAARSDSISGPRRTCLVSNRRKRQ